MAAMPPDELLRLWRQEAISTEMAIGHITQSLVKLQEAMDAQRQLLQATLETHHQTLTSMQNSLAALGVTAVADGEQRKPSKRTTG